MPTQAILKIRYKTGEEDEFKLESDRAYYTFGRSHECDYRLCSSKISNVHFTILRHPSANAHRIIDGFPGRRQGGEIVSRRVSTNGILLNGEPVTSSEEKLRDGQGRHELKHGDKLVLPDETEIEYFIHRPSRTLERAEEDTEASYPIFTEVNLSDSKQ
jgi:pSer/pThr/pTyr-binding forkhead associated (FHA) protein